MNPPGDLQVSLSRFILEEGLALVGGGSVSLSFTFGEELLAGCRLQRKYRPGVVGRSPSQR